MGLTMKGYYLLCMCCGDTWRDCHWIAHMNIRSSCHSNIIVFDSSQLRKEGRKEGTEKLSRYKAKQALHVLVCHHSLCLEQQDIFLCFSPLTRHLPDFRATINNVCVCVLGSRRPKCLLECAATCTLFCPCLLDVGVWRRHRSMIDLAAFLFFLKAR